MMPDRYVFADEAGCFTFAKKQNVSRYLTLCTVVMHDCHVATDLLSLRRYLAWQRAELGEYFHASEDNQNVRDHVFETLNLHKFTIQAQILEKAKAQPQLTKSKERFYKYAYFYLFKFGTRHQLAGSTRTLITTASLGQRKERSAYQAAVADVMQQTNAGEWRTDFAPCHTDPCLQVVDYCAWAIQRKWERNDKRSYDLIKDKITYEYDLFRNGSAQFY